MGKGVEEPQMSARRHGRGKRPRRREDCVPDNKARLKAVSQTATMSEPIFWETTESELGRLP
jgi:hypothetical protein